MADGLKRTRTLLSYSIETIEVNTYVFKKHNIFKGWLPLMALFLV